MEKHGVKLAKIVGTSGSAYKLGRGDLHLIKSSAPRWGHPQEWDIVDPRDPDRALVTGTSLSDACFRLAMLVNLL